MITTDNCSGKDRWHSCWREIGGYQGSDYEIFTGPGWFSRVLAGDVGRFEIPNWFIDPKDKVLKVERNHAIPGVCDHAFQYALINQEYLIENIQKEFGKKVQETLDNANADKSGGGVLYTWITSPLYGFVGSFWGMFNSLFKVGIGMLDMGEACLTKAVTSEAMVNLSSILTLGGGRKIRDIIQTRNDFDCPTQTLSASEATAAYLTDNITYCEWEAYVRADNRIFPQYSVMAGVGKFKFSANELQTLKMRGAIDDAGLKKRLSAIGVMDTSLSEELAVLSIQLPGSSDLIRFMVRDVADQNAVQSNDLDEGFDQKWTGKLKEWGKAIGLTDEIALYHWRAHWEIPPPSQLYVMLHRLRDDPDQGGAISFEQEIRDALVMQDIAPRWVDRLMKISYAPLTRTDAKRAFNEGILSEDELNTVFKQNGYNDEDAEKLTTFAKVERREYIKGREPVKQFINGVIGVDEMGTALRKMGFKDEVIPIAEDVGKESFNWKMRGDYFHRVISIYRSYKVTYDQAMDLGRKMDLDIGSLGVYLDREALIRNYGSKHLSPATACRMMDEGLLTADQYVREMREAGWNSQDAERQLFSCTNKNESKRAKQLLQQQQKEEREQKAKEKADQQAANAADKERDAFLKDAQRLEGKRQARNKIMEASAVKLSSYGKLSPEESAATVTSTYDMLVRSTRLQQDEAVTLIKSLADQWSKFEGQTFAEVALKLANSAKLDPWMLTEGILPTEQP